MLQPVAQARLQAPGVTIGTTMQTGIIKSDILALQAAALPALRPILAGFHLHVEQSGYQVTIDTLAGKYAKRGQIQVFSAAIHRNIMSAGLFAHERA